MTDRDNAPSGLAGREVPAMTMMEYIVATANGIDPLVLPTVGDLAGLGLDVTGLWDYPLKVDAVVAVGLNKPKGGNSLYVFGSDDNGPYLTRVRLGKKTDVFDVNSSAEIDGGGVKHSPLELSRKGGGRKISPTDAYNQIMGSGKTPTEVELVVTVDRTGGPFKSENLKIHQRPIVSTSEGGRATGPGMRVINATTSGGSRYGRVEPEGLNNWHLPIPLPAATPAEPEVQAPEKKKALPFTSELFQQALDFVADAINDGPQDKNGVPYFKAQMDALSASDREKLMRYVAGDLNYVSEHLLTFPGYWLEKSNTGSEHKIVEAIRLYISQQKYLDREVADVADRKRRMEFTKAGMYRRITKQGNYMVDCALASELRNDEREYFPGFNYKQSISELLIEKSGLVKAVSRVFARLGIDITGENTIRKILNENLFLVQDKSAWPPLFSFWKNVLHGSIQERQPIIRRSHASRPNYTEGRGLSAQNKLAFDAIKNILPLISRLVAQNQYNVSSKGSPLTDREINVFLEEIGVSLISPDDVRLAQQAIMRNLEEGIVNVEVEELPREP